MHNINNYCDIIEYYQSSDNIVHLHGRIELHHVGEVRHVFPNDAWLGIFHVAADESNVILTLGR